MIEIGGRPPSDRPTLRPNPPSYPGAPPSRPTLRPNKPGYQGKKINLYFTLKDISNTKYEFRKKSASTDSTANQK